MAFDITLATGALHHRSILSILPHMLQALCLQHTEFLAEVLEVRAEASVTETVNQVLWEFFFILEF